MSKYIEEFENESGEKRPCDGNKFDTVSYYEKLVEHLEKKLEEAEKEKVKLLTIITLYKSGKKEMAEKMMVEFLEEFRREPKQSEVRE